MMSGRSDAPSTMLRMVPLPRFAGEDLAPRPPAPSILPRSRGVRRTGEASDSPQGTAPPGPAEGRPEYRLRRGEGAHASLSRAPTGPECSPHDRALSRIRR